MFLMLDNWFPWFGDMMALGGDILWLIVILAALMWALILERFYYLFVLFPLKLPRLKQAWQHRPNKKNAWYATQFRQLLMSRAARDVHRNLGFIRTLIKICPLLGLLGTVLGMLEIFDVLAATGNSNARATAGGVSKATVSTMAGMVVAISGLMISNVLLTKADSIKLLLQELFAVEAPTVQPEESGHA